MDAIAKNDGTCFIGGSSCLLAVVWLIAGIAPVTATAADELKSLTKAEVEAIAVGKRLQYQRTEGSTVIYDLKDNGRAYYVAQRTQRNLTIGGNYTIGDQGELCFKWEADKYVTLQDGCFLFKREGAKTHVYRRRDPDTPIGDLIE